MSHSTYTGETVDGVPYGQGQIVYANKYFKYSGEWVDGVKHGQGVFQLGDGSTYEGEFVNGEIQGHGIRRFADGSTYSGDFVEGEFNGVGTYIGADGSRYEGDWVDNQHTGKGIYEDGDGGYYEGDFKNHKFHGNGVFESRNGGWVFEGTFVDGKRTGPGFLTIGGKLEYEGPYVDDAREGRGRTTDLESGVTLSDGLWANDALMTRATHLVFDGFEETFLELLAPTPTSEAADAEKEKGKGGKGKPRAGSKSKDDHVEEKKTAPEFELAPGDAIPSIGIVVYGHESGDNLNEEEEAEHETVHEGGSGTEAATTSANLPFPIRIESGRRLSCYLTRKQPVVAEPPPARAASTKSSRSTPSGVGRPKKGAPSKVDLQAAKEAADPEYYTRRLPFGTTPLTANAEGEYVREPPLPDTELDGPDCHTVVTEEGKASLDSLCIHARLEPGTYVLSIEDDTHETESTQRIRHPISVTIKVTAAQS